MFKKSPLAPKAFPILPKIAGIKKYSINAGIRNKRKLDTMLILMPNGANVACVVTKSYTPSAPVLWCKKVRKNGKAKALIVNSGNANAHTGKQGDKTVRDTVKAVTSLFNCSKDEVYVCSTGVIGEQLDSKILTSAISDIYDKKDESSWEEVAKSICTTDTFSKGAVQHFEIAGKKYKIIGIAKGSGMIYPNMGTMLSFVFTDFPLLPKLLNKILQDSVEVSFNSITVDGDTSTSDTCILFSIPGKNTKYISNFKDKRIKLFKATLDKLLVDLAKQIVADGEGAKKLISVRVKSAKTYKSAKIIALSIANSPLIKTAIAGEDPNWGRIIMAIGKSNIPIKQNLISINLCGVNVTHLGFLVDNYDEKKVADKMKEEKVSIDIDLGLGKDEATVWTCDLTHDYININADYRS